MSRAYTQVAPKIDSSIFRAFGRKAAAAVAADTDGVFKIDRNRSLLKTVGIVLLFLTACAPQTPVFNPVDVEIPVAAPCPRAPVEKPDFALSHAAPSDDLAQKTRAALIELNQRRAYETLLEAGNTPCL
jgi:hypothetical protein